MKPFHLRSIKYHCLIVWRYGKMFDEDEPFKQVSSLKLTSFKICFFLYTRTREPNPHTDIKKTKATTATTYCHNQWHTRSHCFTIIVESTQYVSERESKIIFHPHFKKLWQKGKRIRSPENKKKNNFKLIVEASWLLSSEYSRLV